MIPHLPVVLIVLVAAGAALALVLGTGKVRTKRRHARAASIVRTEAEKHGWSEARQAAEHKHLTAKRRLGKKKWRHV